MWNDCQESFSRKLWKKFHSVNFFTLALLLMLVTNIRYAQGHRFSVKLNSEIQNKYPQTEQLLQNNLKFKELIKDWIGSYNYKMNLLTEKYCSKLKTISRSEAWYQIWFGNSNFVLANKGRGARADWLGTSRVNVLGPNRL